MWNYLGAIFTFWAAVFGLIGLCVLLLWVLPAILGANLDSRWLMIIGPALLFVLSAPKKRA